MCPFINKSMINTFWRLAVVFSSLNCFNQFSKYHLEVNKERLLFSSLYLSPSGNIATRDPSTGVYGTHADIM